MLSEEQREKYLDLIISEADRLTTLSSNVLLLSKVENANDFIIDNPFSLDEQLRETILLPQPQISKKNLNLDIELQTIQINSNEELLQHVWLNIIGNAIKFTPMCGQIKITLSTDDKDAKVIISDSRSGIKEEEKDYLFDKFYQGDKSRTIQGNGLGLALSKKIIDLVKGKINLENNIDGGTSFIITLQKMKEFN